MKFDMVTQVGFQMLLAIKIFSFSKSTMPAVFHFEIQKIAVSAFSIYWVLKF